MRINPDQCIGCRVCLEYCPGNAVRVDANKPDILYVSEEWCFECGLCLRLNICPVNAFYEPPESREFPRVVRSLFSNPNTTHRLTLVPGRGTEESKTNDVTGRVKRGEIGFCIELGRPGLGCRFHDITHVIARLRGLGLQLEPNNPLTGLMDIERGDVFEELLPQRILSAVIEVKLSSEELEKIVPTILQIGEEVDTVFSLGVICRFGEHGELTILGRLERLGLSAAPNAKINVGLGKPLCED